MRAPGSGGRPAVARADREQSGARAPRCAGPALHAQSAPRRLYRRSRMTAPLALTMGEPAGIGGEITLMAWQKRAQSALPPFFIIDNPSRLERLAARLGLSVPLRPIAPPRGAAPLLPTAPPGLPIQP